MRDAIGLLGELRHGVWQDSIGRGDLSFPSDDHASTQTLKSFKGAVKEYLHGMEARLFEIERMLREEPE